MGRAGLDFDFGVILLVNGTLEISDVAFPMDAAHNNSSKAC